MLVLEEICGDYSYLVEKHEEFMCRYVSIKNIVYFLAKKNIVSNIYSAWFDVGTKEND
jgi:hypothetical protein